MLAFLLGWAVVGPGQAAPADPAALAADLRIIHVFVALADNAHQNIAPVPAALGDGDDARGNLYWGARYGVRTHLGQSAAWSKPVSLPVPEPAVLERIALRRAGGGAVLIADAYRGSEIRAATLDFLRAAAGERAAVAELDGQRLAVGGAAELVVYIGHDGLMDFAIPEPPLRAGRGPRGAIVLACVSQRYFGPSLRAAGVAPVLVTTGLMAPEAYVLEAALEGWLRNEAPAAIRERAARAYDRYQHCGLRGARRLFATTLD